MVCMLHLTVTPPELSRASTFSPHELCENAKLRFCDVDCAPSDRRGRRKGEDVAGKLAPGFSTHLVPRTHSSIENCRGA